MCTLDDGQWIGDVSMVVTVTALRKAAREHCLVGRTEDDQIGLASKNGWRAQSAANSTTTRHHLPPSTLRRIAVGQTRSTQHPVLILWGTCRGPHAHRCATPLPSNLCPSTPPETLGGPSSSYCSWSSKDECLLLGLHIAGLRLLKPPS
jgi:hypothetical protein